MVFVSTERMARRIVFMGSDEIALPALDWLWTDGRAVAELVGVYTRPDRPHGRGQRLTPNAIKTWALQRAIPVFQPEKLTPEARATFSELRPDAALVMAFGHILRQEWIDTPRCSMWNLHASLLPKYRGASPIQGAIAGGETESGVCLMRIVRALDAGPVLDWESVGIGEMDTGADLEARLSQACLPLLARSLDGIFAPEPPVIEQSHAEATFTRKLRKDDGALDFRVPARVLARRINALFPWPGAFFDLEGDRIRVGLAEVDSSETCQRPRDATPGAVLHSGSGALVVAAGGAGCVGLLRLQRPGGRMLPAEEFLRGRAIDAGTVLLSAPMPPFIASEPIKG